MKKITQTAGREALNDFAPAFAHYNDDILFGENWNDESINHKTRCIITVVCLISSGITDSSLIYHLENAKKAGVTSNEIAGIITHTAFYAGWPKAWAAFNLAKSIWNKTTNPSNDKEQHQSQMIFSIGEPNDAYAKYFIGQSYLSPISNKQVSIFNVTFEPGCRNNWHIHHSDKDGGQILICVAGKGYYQEWGKDVIEMNPGDCINIPPGVKHWHGATPDSWFSHIAVEVPGENTSNEWLEPVDDKQYFEIK